MATNQSLDRGLAILDLLDGEARPMGIRDIARALDISPTIVQRLANTLAAAGYLEQMPETRRYRLGYRAVVLGGALRRDDHLLANAARELRRMADEHHLNGYLGALRDHRVVYIDSVQSSGPIAVRSMPGERAHAHSTAMGKILIAELAAAELARVVGPAPYPALTAHTLVTAEALDAELAEVRRRGFALSREENLVGVISVAAAIRNQSGRIAAALSVAFLASEHDAARWPAITQLVLDAAHRCARSLGHDGPPIQLTGENAHVA